METMTKMRKVFEDLRCLSGSVKTEGLWDYVIKHSLYLIFDKNCTFKFEHMTPIN